MSSFLQRRARAFRDAFRGWRHIVRTQPNTWIHSLIGTLVVLAALWLGLPARDWAVLVLTIAMVWAAEALNTAIEAVVDLISPDHHPLAGIAKDVGAAAVLIAALAAVIIGILILGPPLWAYFQGWLA